MNPKPPTLLDATPDPDREPPPVERVPDPVPVPDSRMALVIQRLAENPSVDVAKLEKVIELQERLLAHEARAAFNAAYSRMQADLPEITEQGKITNRDGSVRSKYARLEDIQRECRPTLKQYGFAVRHRTEWPGEGTIRVVGILSHELGHSEESVFEAKADASDYRTDIQSQGSTVSYGRRYTTLDLLGIITKGADNDGATQGRPAPPEGYEDFILGLEAAAGKGTIGLDIAYQAGSMPLRLYLGKNDAPRYAAIRRRASDATREAGR